MLEGKLVSKNVISLPLNKEYISTCIFLINQRSEIFAFS